MTTKDYRSSNYPPRAYVSGGRTCEPQGAITGVQTDIWEICVRLRDPKWCTMLIAQRIHRVDFWVLGLSFMRFGGLTSEEMLSERVCE